MAKAATSATAQMTERIERAKPGWVFTPFDFLDLGSPQAVGMTLTRLVRSGAIRRLARGLYDVPRSHKKLGALSPTAEAIAQALARREGATLQPSDAMAANLLHLSEQVPARASYETDGSSRTVRVGKLTMRLAKRPRRKVGSAAPMSSLVFGALRSLGKGNVTQERVAHLRKTLSAAHRRKLLADLPLAPAWMHPSVRFIAGDVARRGKR